ncbi:alpha/beta hydrolase [Aquimarina macrocephali]|uniref:alpha/beta hydrolase n=1 Tax=Aquimarina macrocephali TaxID=666563 RepID=UPI000A00273A|nr:alpha/beta hydrolase-fold protein [Aquimarina macrocephali]
MKLFKILVLAILMFLNSRCTEAQQSIPKDLQKETINSGEPIIIGQKFKIHSNVLGEEKEIYISLPHKYDERVHSYPVVYVLEAEFLFEAAGTITKYMAARSKMPQSIIIGLSNGEFEKRKELGYKKWNGIPEKYIEFFKKELIPYIDKSYRVNSHRTIIGLSPTNGFLFEAFLSEPNMFKGYIALSAHLEWNRKEGEELFDEILSKTNDPNYPKNTLYLGRADNDLIQHPNAKAAYTDAKQKLENIQTTNATIKLDILENEEHYLMSLAGIRNGFATIYPNSLWRNPGWMGWDKNENYAQNYYKKYYDKLSAIYGFDIYPVEDGHSYGYYLSGKAYAAKKWGTNKQVIDLLELGIGYYPNSANLHMLLAEAYQTKGDAKLASEIAKKALLLVEKYHPEELGAYKEQLEKQLK